MSCLGRSNGQAPSLSSAVAERDVHENKRQRPVFLITVDVEGDDLWSKPQRITTENAKYLHRFQELCEEFSLKPTYLVDYEMAKCNEFVEFGREILRRKTAEIGMHLHGWNTPPLYQITDADYVHSPYLVDYPPNIMKEKVRTMTLLLEDTFSVKIKSHRAGRWSLDERYAAILANEGYTVDCSITPHLSWALNIGAPGGKGESDYTEFPEDEYWLNLGDISKPGTSSLLEVPLTVVPVYKLMNRRLSAKIVHQLINSVRMIRSSTALKLSSKAARVLRPNGRNRQSMLAVLDYAVKRKRYAQFMIHSSELVAWINPKLPDGTRN